MAFVLVWCTGYIAGTLAVAHGGPLTTLVLRFGLTTLVFALLALVGRASWPARRELGHSAVVGALLLALQFGGMYIGLRLGATAGVAALATGSMPLVVALLALAGGERLGGGQWSGLAIGFCGVAMVVADRVDGATPPLAWLALGASVLGISLGTLYQKRHASRLDMRVGLTVQNATATLLVLPLAIVLEGVHFERSAAFLLPLAWLVGVNSVGGFALLFVLIRRGAATKVAALFFLMPPVTAVMGWLWLGEHLTLLKGAGFACAAAGVWLATRRAAPPGRA
ncbi:DMT family transporter [Coralloluteibacterium stylophorae]|nr:DMT family transporter [Coralloluteibacterium stylophorae]